MYEFVSAGRHEQEGKTACSDGFEVWCGRRGSNSNGFLRWYLKPVRLPIPPRPQCFYDNRGRETNRPGIGRLG